METGALLRRYGRLLRRRWWVIAVTGAVAALAAFGFSVRQEKLYEASASVYLSRQSIASTLGETPDPNINQPADRFAQTQATLARAPDVARNTLEAAGLKHRSVQEFLDSSSVTPVENADFIEFRVRDERATTARILATTYAKEFTNYGREIQTAAIQRVLNDVDQQLVDLDRAGRGDSTLATNLHDRKDRLQALQAIQATNAFVVTPAGAAELVQPKTVRNVVVGGVLGIALGFGIALLLETLDTRLFSAEEVSELLGCPVLARIPSPARRTPLAQLPMVHDPEGPGAEPYRVLRTNFEFANLTLDAHTVLVTSAGPAEGKSLTVLNLAVAFARAEKQVALLDLDLRNPSIAQLAGIDQIPGLTDAALASGTSDTGSFSQTIRAEPGQVDVFPGGSRPPSIGDFMGTSALADILREIEVTHDQVLIDAPPMLTIGDAAVLSARVDAAVIVARLGKLTRRSATKLREQLAAAQVVSLGCVVTGVSPESPYERPYRSTKHRPRETVS